MFRGMFRQSPTISPFGRTFGMSSFNGYALPTDGLLCLIKPQTTTTYTPNYLEVDGEQVFVDGEPVVLDYTAETTTEMVDSVGDSTITLISGSLDDLMNAEFSFESSIDTLQIDTLLGGDALFDSTDSMVSIVRYGYEWVQLDNTDFLFVAASGVAVYSSAQDYTSAKKVLDYLSWDFSARSRWDLLKNNSRTMLLWGSSSVEHAVDLFNKLEEYTGSGDPLEGVTFLNYGNNGAELLSVLNNDGSPEWEYDEVGGAHADLVCMNWLSNDVRTGNCDLETAIDRLSQAITLIRELSPTTSILIYTGLAYLLDDPGDTGYVVPLSSSQDYTDILHAAHIAVAAKFPNITFRDHMALIGGTTCRNYADNSLMRDILHANAEGQELQAEDFISFLGYQETYDQALADAARAVSYHHDYEIYNKAVEDTQRYELRAEGRWDGQSDGVVKFTFPYEDIDMISKTDILCLGSTTPWMLPVTTTFSAFVLATQLNVGTGNPPTEITGGWVRVYRHKYAGVELAETTYNEIDYPYRWAGFITSGNVGGGWGRVTALNGEVTAASRVPDMDKDTEFLLFEDGTVLSGFNYINVSGDNASFSHSGITSALALQRVLVVGPVR